MGRPHFVWPFSLDAFKAVDRPREAVFRRTRLPRSSTNALPDEGATPPAQPSQGSGTDSSRPLPATSSQTDEGDRQRASLQMSRRLRPEEYTVGWICALRVELEAAREMLDEVHEDLECDGLLYSLGSIEKHNVVVACLPANRIGNNPAADVEKMTAKFERIQFGLMVGIGGGVPSANPDIRLGDVVVSQRYLTLGGVKQPGKATPSGLEQTGSLNSPPPILLSALTKVQANELLGKSTLSKHVSKLGHIPKFQRDSAGPDILFEATYDHKGGQTCNLCSTDRQIARQPRKSEEVVVHYGTIASGNQVVKDGCTRDRLSRELGGILCFETEAAGLINSFPCLVIRGVCDYADSHKNKKWQSYAAGTAAGYAKEVLLVIPPDVAKARTVKEARTDTISTDSYTQRLESGSTSTAI